MEPQEGTNVHSLPGEEGWDSTSSASTSPTIPETQDDSNSHETSLETAGQEGSEELQSLDVEVYDQQTYERGIFQQVDNAISQVDKQTENKPKQSTSKQADKITDLMRVVHAQGDKEVDDEEEVCDPTERDQQVLNLTRLQRLNKTSVIKQERNIPGYCEFQVKSLPKIPRLSTQKPTPCKSKSLSNDDIHIRESMSRSELTTPIRIKQEKIDIIELDDSTSDASSHSEYKPDGAISGEESENLNDKDIDYDTDDQLNTSSGLNSDDEELKTAERQKMRLRDDGDLKTYRKRIKEYNRELAKQRLDNILEDGTEVEKIGELVEIDGNLQIPKEMWDNLFEHQKTGVRWLWELHQLGSGGVLGDEMGLGKTIQMIAFLTALKSSELRDPHRGYKNLGPTILVCPATVMHQWLLEFRKWYPPFRVAILHSTGTFCGIRKNLVEIINKSQGVLIVSYPGVVIYQDVLHDFDWHYAILDEGHKIRNPDAQVTLACKRFRTPHRIILSGSPVQNNLRELWSIFDFIYPGKLGTLPVFMEQFATPITQGGYSNASDIQVQIAYKCACVLRDTIKPFLLRRTKAEVNSKLKLPDRSEQVLFCKLTEKQRKLYEAYLSSPTIRDIKSGFCQIFVGLIQLRKICNHPDLFDPIECKNQIKQSKEAATKKNLEFFSEDETFGHIKKSGKMMVVDALLKLWKKQNHKVLLFTQSRQMLRIFMNYLDELNYKYLFMDGTTSIGNRQTLIEQFNNNEDIFIFLLTTRVGGVGINLTGANRIIIYDPDWNPSTDIQARERAWRIGQKRHVIIYRLLTAGTIEEKIYHRQVFKLYLTNRVLKNAKQKRFFKTNDLHELFTLGDNEKNIETKALFDDDLQINQESIEKSKRKKKAKKAKKKRKQLELSSAKELASNLLSEEKLQAMRERAKKLSQMIAAQYGPVKIKAEPESVTDNGAAIESTSWTPVVIKTEPGLDQPIEINSIIGNETSNPTENNNNLQLQRKNHVKRVKKEGSSKQHVEYLVKQDVYKPNKDDKKCDSRYKKDDYILEQLFKSSNVSGALRHDKIEADSTDDYKVVESEAEKVARDAIKALRESRAHCLDSSMGVPNWTGRNGQFASTNRLMPKNKTRLKFLTKLGPPASSSSSTSGQDDSLLSSIKKRNQTNPVPMNRYSNGSLALYPPDRPLDDEEERDRDFAGKSVGTGAEVIADKLRKFIMFRSAKNGESQTDEVLEFFNSNFSPDKTPIFKAVLYKICEFKRRGNIGFWILKSEFRDI